MPAVPVIEPKKLKQQTTYKLTHSNHYQKAATFLKIFLENIHTMLQILRKLTKSFLAFHELNCYFLFFIKR